MDPKPMRRYGKPGYPTRLQALTRPQLLEKHLPPAWRDNAGMAGVVALLLAANGCTRMASTAPVDSNAPAGTVAGSSRPPIPAKARLVAPVFEHGEGRGATGCIVVAPPVFLSEEEALQTIVEQLSRSGVNVTTANTTLPELIVEQDFKPVYGTRHEPLPSGGVKTTWGVLEGYRGAAKPLEVDGLAADNKIAFEFISQSDYRSFGGARSMSTVQEYDFKPVAREFADRVAEKDKDIYFGTFYDPMVTPDILVRRGGGIRRSFEQEQAENRELAKSLLRQQVQDFVNWLKAQGAI